MKIVFAGPTLHGIARDAFPSIEFRQPAKCGDVIKAVQDGATMLGLIDGVFELTPAVWHKEILFALSEGITVLGAASMGALRAAECHPFGMIGVGAVFQAYASGATDDDEDVAQLHGPAELGHLPLSEPWVNIQATLDHLRVADLISAVEQDALAAAARRQFFKDRAYKKIVEAADLSAPRKAELLLCLTSNSINVKQNDALLLLSMIENGEIRTDPGFSRPKWQLANTRTFRQMLQRDGIC
jgi:hypothetical protein